MPGLTQLCTEEKIERSSLLIAPVLFAASSFFWCNGEYSVISSTLLILSLFFWLPAFRALFKTTCEPLPLYSTWGLWIAYFGCISGVCFAFLGYITAVLNISHKEYIEALSHYPFTSQLLLFASGPLFPLSILLLGIQLLRKKIVPMVIALMLCIAGIGFPVSRIPRIELLAHIADIILVIPCFYIALKKPGIK